MLAIIADAHLESGSSGEQDFMTMLQRLADSDMDVCFLGDIMELWIAFPKHETELQQTFLRWCQKQRCQRQITFIEGNHEFFVAHNHRDNFSAAAVKRLQCGEVTFIHGDLLQQGQYLHGFWHFLSKGFLSYLVLRFLPGAPFLTKWLKNRLQSRHASRKTRLPRNEIKHHLQREQRRGSRYLFFGHFHVAGSEESTENLCWYSVPAWKDQQQIMLWEPQTRKSQIVDWRQLQLT